MALEDDTQCVEVKLISRLSMWRRGSRVNVGLAVTTAVVLLIVVFSDLVVLPILTSNAASHSHYYPQSFVEFGATGSLVQQSKLQELSDRRARGEGSAPAIYVNDSSCMYGGVLTKWGCVCGRGTEGDHCETLSVSQEELDNVMVCGTECWAAYVWYPTEHFKFRPIEPHEERIVDKAKVVSAWKDGGQWRPSLVPALSEAPDMGEESVALQSQSRALVGVGGGVEDKGLAPPIHPAVLDWMVSLGPWTAADRQMLARLNDFHHYDVPRLREGYAARLLDPTSRQPKPRASLCFGLMMHRDPWQFQALWDVLYRPQHHYIIHIDAQSDPDVRQQVTAIIQATPFEGPGSVWDRVEVIPLQDSVPAFWGDVTLVYLELVMWMRAFLRTDWEWDYFINMSIADIPIVSMDYIEDFLGRSMPTSYMSWHPNVGEFRQIHFVPERDRLREVVALSPRQADMPSGRWRVKHGQTRLYGCTQWHMWHWTMAWEFAANPLVHGLLLSLKDTGIPDECFFATAAVWLSETVASRGAPVPLPIAGGDYKYRNEGTNRNLNVPGELEHLKAQSAAKVNLWARKAYTAEITCRLTNALLELDHDCSRYEGKDPPDEAQR